MQKFFELLIGCACALSFTAQAFADEAGGVQFSLDKEGRKWKKGDAHKDDQVEIATYILEDESPSKWTEIVTVQAVKGLKMAPEKFFNLFLDQLKTLVPGKKVESKILKQSDNTLFAEWWIDDKSPEAQHEWVRIIQTPEALITIRYTTKKLDQVDAVRSKWEGFLNEVKPVDAK